jgi:hypothetical protein
MGVLAAHCRWWRAPARIGTACGLLVAASLAHATSYDLAIDMRVVDSNGRNSYLDGGQGKLRYDEGDSGLHLGRMWAAITQPLGEVFSLHAEATSWGDYDKSPVDLTEAYLEYKPYPVAGFRTRVRLGAFYPPMSLENRALGWETPYSITPSPISSWIGEEIRTIGLEGQVDWLGTRMGHSFDLQLTGALFGWNDPAGTMLALNGFVLDDRQTTLFGRVGKPGIDPEEPDREMFHEMDHRAGYYVGGQLRYLDRAVLNVLHYDNRGDPTQYVEKLENYAWNTRFDAAALRVESARGWTLLLQWLDGATVIEPNNFHLEWDFDSRSAMVARSFGRHQLAARYDTFEVEMGQPLNPGNEDGHAWTAAYSFEPGNNWRFMLEWLRVRSDVKARPVQLGEPALATETKVEVSVRYAIGGQF